MLYDEAGNPGKSFSKKSAAEKLKDLRLQCQRPDRWAQYSRSTGGTCRKGSVCQEDGGKLA